MKISEVFASIQGEGILSGVPSLFIRVSGCNLRCTWCDTPYTSWEPSGEEWGIDRILDWVAQHPAYRHIVLTGGEPMLFADSVPLTKALAEAGLHITVETAGTVYQPIECQLMSVSPKLANSTPRERDGGRFAVMHEEARRRPDVLRRLAVEYDCQWKFVVTGPEDLPEIREFAAIAGATPDRVLLMPEGVTAEALNDRSRWLVDLCKAEGYRFCPRLHILLYGNRRGV